MLAREGRIEDARQRHEEALALRDRLGEKGTAAESRLALALLLLDSGDAPRAGELAREAAAELGREGAAEGEALALAVTALAGQSQGDTRQVRESLDRAAGLLQGSQDLRARLAVELRTARLHAPAEGERRLRIAVDEAARAGLVEIRLEGELALADLEAARGRAADAQARRATLEKEAKAKGYGWIARRAAPSPART